MVKGQCSSPFNHGRFFIKIMYARAVYGHGARKDYDLEWRHQAKFSRGGVMYDQGSHIADLSVWFLEPIEKVFANSKKYFWKRTSLEDNAFCQIVSKTGQVLAYQNSLTQWKNRFSFEVYGEKGYLLVNGLGRSYGVETLVWGKRIGLGQVPHEQTWEFPGEDKSWNLEWSNFRGAILEKKLVLSSGEENVVVMKIIDALYKSAKSGKLTKI
jgi:predicted dehydrogenase